MLEIATVACPICDNELQVKVSRAGKTTTYIVTKSCAQCRTSAEKIERQLNSLSRSPHFKTERGYIKLDPRG